MTNESKPYKKFAQGIFIVKSKNGSFNSDFSGLPRRLPDKEGTIYATDKALKYCIRKYLHDKGEKVFVWRRDDGKGDPINLKENYESFCKELKIEPDLKKADNKAVLVNLLKALDSRLFGVTFAMNSSDEKEKKNVSVTGSAQISYGINKLKESQFYNNQIMSPYKNKDSDKQRTLGSETKTLEAHYVYDFIVNPNNLISDIEFVDEKERTNLLLSGQDVGNFKEAICKGVNYVNSASKIGCEGELLIFIETETEEENGKLRGLLLPLMKDLVEVKEGEKEITEIDVSKLFDNLPSYLSDKKVASIEIYYDSNFTNLVGIKESSNLQIKRKNIVTLEEIK